VHFCTITFGANKFQSAWQVDLTDKIGSKENTALKHYDEYYLTRIVIRGNLRAETLDGIMDLLTCEKLFEMFIVELYGIVAHRRGKM
jgi:hypothetical protein